MKILCIAPERSEVLAVTSTLPDLSSGVSLSWAERFEDAAFWIFHNRDVAALVIDAQVGSEPCAALLANLHRRGLAAPTIVVADQPSLTPDALGLGPDDCLLPRSALVRDLPAAVSRALEGHPPAPPADEREVSASREQRSDVVALDARFMAERDVLEAALARAEAALREASARHASEIRAAGDRFADRERVLAAEIATLTTSHEALERRCADAEAAVQVARDSGRRVEQTAAEQLTRLDSELQEALARELCARQAIEAALARAERDRVELNAAHAAAAAELGIRLREQEAQLQVERSSSQAARDALDARCAGVQAAREAERTQAARDAEAAVAEAVARERAVSERLAQQLQSVERARREADEAALRDRAALVAAQAEARRILDEATALSSQRERAAAERLAREVGLRRSAEVKLSRAEAAARQAASEHAEALAVAAEQVAERDARLAREHTSAQSAHAALAQQLEAAERTRSEAEQAAAHDRHRAAERLAEREQALGRQIEALGEQAQALRGQIADAASARDALVQRLTIADAALQAAQRALATLESTHASAKSEHAQALAAAGATIAAHEAQQKAAQADLADLEARLQAADHARRDVDAVSARERLAADAELTRLRAELDLAREEGAAAMSEAATQSAAREQALSAQLADAVAEQVRFAREASKRDRTLQESIAEEIEKRETVERALDQAARASETAAAEHAAALAAAADRLAECEARLEAERRAAQETRHGFERQLESAAQSQREALDRAAQELAAAVAHTARLQADFDAKSQCAQDQRAMLETQIGGLETASRDAERLHADAMMAVVAEADQRRQQLEAQLAERTAQLDALRCDLTERADTCARLQEDVNARSAEIDRLRRREAALVSEVEAESSARAIVEREREDLIRQHEEFVGRLDRERNELHARLIAAREESARLQREQANSQQEAAQACDKLRELEARIAVHVQEATAHAQEKERLRGDLTAATRDVAATREERDALTIEACRANSLQRDFDRFRIEATREFNQHPLPLLRCDLDGTLTQVNRAFAQMVGHGSADDAQRVALVADLFQASNDLRWLVERSRTAGVITQTESTLKCRDGRRIVVRLSASATPSGAQVVVQDLTPQRVAQSALDQARRLEAVGRLGTEVAVTASQLLRDVYRDGERWLSAFDGTRVMRRRVELLLGDVARAAGHLDQLTAFGEQQANVIPSVDLRCVLHDLGPVLRQIAGDEVEILLPNRAEGSPTFEVDVEADRVERLLVNVASYCRDRLPTGGSMRFELAPTVVDQAFIEKHPTARPGPHVVLTVAEVNGPIRLMGPSTHREELAFADDDEPVSSGGVGVELGALQAIVRGCQGHLWVDAASSGDLTLRIHLPLKVA